jgi:hypothetical protein
MNVKIEGWLCMCAYRDTLDRQHREAVYLQEAKL